MYRAITLAAILVGFCTTTSWAQFGGQPGMGMSAMGMEDVQGGIGKGVEGGVGMGLGGFGPVHPNAIGADKPITAFAGPGVPGAKLQVIWEASQGYNNQALHEKIHSAETKVEFIDTPLIETVAFLKDMHDIQIFVHVEELAEIGFSTDEPVTLSASKMTLASTLDIMLQPIGMSWYIDKGALVITSKEAMQEHRSIRIYRLNYMNSEGAAKIVRNMITPDDWREEMDGQAKLSVVEDANLLVVRHHRVGHAAIEGLLKSMEGLGAAMHEPQGNFDDEPFGDSPFDDTPVDDDIFSDSPFDSGEAESDIPDEDGFEGGDAESDEGAEGGQGGFGSGFGSGPFFPSGKPKNQ